MSARKHAPSRVPAISAADREKAGGGLAARIPSLIEAWRSARGRPAEGKLGQREIEEAGAALLALQRGLTGERRLAGERYMEKSDLLGAYLLYYWPVSYMQVALSLASPPRVASSPRRVLDLGSGPGPASAALLDAALEGGAPLPEELVLVDVSPSALDLAKAILAAGAARPAKLSTLELDLETEPKLPEGSFDLIVMGHCLNELWRGREGAIDRKLALLRRAALSLAPGGRILLIEPALLLTCRELIALRDALAAEGWSVLGPCPGSYACPAFVAGPDRSCHAESPWAPPEPVASLAAAAGLDRSSVKWTHFFLAPGGTPPCPESTIRGTGGRVVSDPMLNKAGRLRYLLCRDGALSAVSARADDEPAQAMGFMDLRRGDVVRAEGFEDRPGGGLGIVAGSKLELLGRAPEAKS
jgi:SAM-dependent methyltransferase